MRFMALPKIGGKAQQAQQIEKAAPMPRRRLGPVFLREAWWGLMCDLLTSPISSQDELLQAANNAESRVQQARDIADAAIQAFEDRWTE